ncbi:hypothetical protein B0H21DRAFT_698452 [Amylocystis lapponica]|nr:hypothetical protein B0H21DRAFT_698452 [Amylocystis lapponica]
MASQQLSESRVWFITGSSQGIGRALLEEILSIGERAVATLRKPAVLTPLVEKYPASQLLVLPLDVTNEAQIIAAFEEAKKHFGRLDVVVNNAGYGLEGEIEATTDEDARRQIEVLFWGPVNVTKEAIKFLRDVNPPGHGGRVLNISSIGGYSANPTLAFYNAGKFALEGFTEAFTKEMLPAWNIKGIIVQLGGYRTEWANGSMVQIPVHPSYNAPDSPTVLFRQMSHVPYIGDPAKAAKALVRIADLPDPPLRIQLGFEAKILVRNKARQTIRESEKYDELSGSTVADDVDTNLVMQYLTQADR